MTWNPENQQRSNDPFMRRILSTLPATEVTELTKEETGRGTGLDFEAEVIVYNCDCHTYRQVIELFCRHIPGMRPSKAFELAWRIDHQGHASVYQGPHRSANEIAGKLAAGGLRVEVR